MFRGAVPALSAALLALGVFTLVVPVQAQGGGTSSAALDRKSSNALPRPRRASSWTVTRL
jgi:hypothetical protein